MLVKDVGDEICMLMAKVHFHSTGVHEIWKSSFCLSWKAFTNRFHQVNLKLMLFGFKTNPWQHMVIGVKCFLTSSITNVVSKIFKVLTLNPKDTINLSFAKRICWNASKNVRGERCFRGSDFLACEKHQKIHCKPRISDGCEISLFHYFHVLKNSSVL